MTGEGRQGESKEALLQVLVVDDDPRSARLLAGILEGEGYYVSTVPSGAFAVQAVHKRAPDMVLLDIEMPGMNGFETCQRIKLLPGMERVPVIFISAAVEVLDKVRAFDVGGVDYVTKPFEPEEVVVRVQTHFELQRLQRTADRQYDELQRLEKLRQDLTRMIVHDMRTPLMGLLGGIELAELDLDQDQRDRALKHLGRSQVCGSELLQMLEDFLAVARLEERAVPLERQECTLGQLLDRAIAGQESALGGGHVQVAGDGTDATLWVDPKLMERVLANLLSNALRYGPEDGEVRVAVTVGEGRVRIEVSDDGPGIPEQHHGLIFEKFGRATAGRLSGLRSVGLGLAFCKLAVEAHGGSIEVESTEGEGATFRVHLPHGTKPQGKGPSFA